MGNEKDMENYYSDFFKKGMMSSFGDKIFFKEVEM